MSALLFQLHDAFQSFITMAAGREPDRTIVITGALGLRALCERHVDDPRLKSAADSLTGLATGGAFALDEASRQQHAIHADTVRRYASTITPDASRGE